MLKFGEKVVKHRKLVLLISIILLIPAALGFVSTRVNYDILSYLPSDIDTMKGQDVMLNEFGEGAFAMYVCEGMDDKDVSSLKKKIEKIDHVKSVIWYDTFMDTSVPKEVMPSKLYKAFNSGDATMMAIFFDSTSSTDETLAAENEIRNLSNKQCFISGMTTVVQDIKNLTEQEQYAYVIIAVLLVSLVLALFMDSWLVPVVFMLSVGMAILYNLGSNQMLGEVSFLTKALAAVLQLGVTMDYSIFLWHGYKEMEEKYGNREEAMAHAIKNTIISVFSSSLTTVAGFLALCFMSFTLGFNLGIVMAKGVVLGVVACVTILPSMILVFDKLLDKTSHKPLMPSFDRFAKMVTNKFWIFIAIFVVLMVPAIYGYSNVNVYYNLTDTMPKDLPSSKGSNILEEKFNMASTYMIMVDSSMDQVEVKRMSEEIDELKGVKNVLGVDTMLGASVPDTLVPTELRDMLIGKDHQMLLVNSSYKNASDDVNKQIKDVNKIVKKYDAKAMVIGEAPCTKDLINITDNDFKMVSAVSIIAVFLIIMIMLKSISLPVVLVAIIEGAIFMNMSLSYYMGTTIPFIASVVIGTIQLGATVDYAILMTTRFRKERAKGKTKKESVQIALSTSAPSVIVSALGFFAATIGVGLYSSVDMVSSLCILMARGAIVSMIAVLFVLPSLFMVFDKLINYKVIKNLKKQGE